jgi:hypothetical protein
MTEYITSADIKMSKILETIIYLNPPKTIVEISYLNSNSLKEYRKLVDDFCNIQIYDIFDKSNSNYMDFFTQYNNIPDNSIDLLIINIANDGNTFKYAVDYYLNKLINNGVMILEGGSKNRDFHNSINHKYKQPLIVPIIKELKKNPLISIKVYEASSSRKYGFENSLTLIQRNKKIEKKDCET